MHVIVAGASGFLGSHLVPSLREAGHDVTRLVRREARADDESSWDPYASEVDQALVAGADAVINLAGSPTAGNPHSPRWAGELRESRVMSTLVLAEAVARAHRDGSGRPAFLAGSAVAFYGDHGSAQLDEGSGSAGSSFMTSVVREWEDASRPARRAGARVVSLRTSPVIDRSSAPLKQMLPMFKLGLGSRIGDGQQYFPVISLRDWVGAVTWLVSSEVTGPVNLCCPLTPTNQDFTRALASAVGRRARLAVPSKLIQVGAGKVAPELLGSIRLRPRVLTEAGYAFADHDARDVVAAALA